MIVNAGDYQALLQEAGLPLLVSEAQIAVHWREEEYYHPPPRFIGQANASDPSLFNRFSEEHFPECFKEHADLLMWNHSWHTTLDTLNPPFWKWFVGGRLNACYNCVDLQAVELEEERLLLQGGGQVLRRLTTQDFLSPQTTRNHG